MIMKAHLLWIEIKKSGKLKKSLKKCFSFIISLFIKCHHTAQNLSQINIVQCGGAPTMAYEAMKKKK